MIQFCDMLFLAIFLFIYMIVNGYYMSVGLFCSVFNDIYSKMFIMTKNEQFSKVLGYDYN